MTRPRRLLTLGHSYCVGLNRRLAHEMARAGRGRWEVTVAAPSFFRGDLRPIRLRPELDEPCRVVGVPTYLSRYIHFMLYGRRLRSLLRESWDLVHCWEEPFILAGAQVAYWTPKGVPLVYATFQNIAKCYPPPFSWAEYYTMCRASGWIAFGRLVEQTVAARTPYCHRPHRVIPPGVDVECFRPDLSRRADALCRLGWDGAGPPVVGFLGRFVAEKGPCLLTAVLDRLTVPWRALFVGTGPLEGPLRAWAGRHGDRVRILTDVSHDGVPARMNAMDVLCAPSQTTPHWREQLGRMLLEAFASGVPVLASDSGEIPQVVGAAGRIIPEGDAKAWGRALADLLESPALRAELAREGLERARSIFAWPVVARQHLDFFEDLLAAAPGGRSHTPGGWKEA